MDNKETLSVLEDLIENLQGRPKRISGGRVAREAIESRRLKCNPREGRRDT